MMEIEEMEASSISSEQNSKRKKDRERIRAKRTKMTLEEKAEANAKAKVAMGEKRNQMTPEEKAEANAKASKAKAKRRGQMTPEEKAEANAKASKATAKRRGQMTPEERDKARADDTAGRSQKRAKMTPEERDKAKAKVKEANMKRRKKREEFCRGKISDEERELHTVWILDIDEKDGEYSPVAKLMFSEEVREEDEGQGGRTFHRGKSRFVLVKSKPDEDDKEFVRNKIEDGGFTFRHDRKKYGYGQKLYFRFGPMTRYPLIDSYAMSEKDKKSGDGREVPNDIDDEMILETSFYLGKMDKECYYCKGKGFKGEIQNKIEGDDLVDFGSFASWSARTAVD